MNHTNKQKGKNTFMTIDEQYMDLALEEAKKAYTSGEIPIGAVILYKNNIIAAAHNLRETIPCATAHAELLAIQEACRNLHRWRLTGCTLYVTVEPCPMCAGAIVNSRLTRLVYGSSDYKAGAVESLFNIVHNKSLNHQAVVTTGVRMEECQQIMKDFFRERRKQLYK